MSEILDRDYVPMAMEGLDITQKEIEQILTDAAMWYKYKKRPLTEFIRDKKKVTPKQVKDLAVIGIKYLMADYVDEIQREKENEENVEEDHES